MNLFRLLLPCYLLVLLLLNGPAAAQPAEVELGLKINQITRIDQKLENFTVVATMKVNWKAPQLGFEPDSEGADRRTYTLPGLKRLMEARGVRWPGMTFSNQQGAAAFENQVAQVHSDGTVNYMERFTATFQAPDFDFRLFPLDHQRFYINVDSLFPVTEFIFVEIEDFGGMGDKLGEEEWVITGSRTGLSTQTESGFDVGSRYTLEFEAERHLNYYILRILVPVLVIVIVSWFTFFLQDYAKRIDLAGANLLLFIAFNFTITNDIPRLGYITLIDGIMVGVFIITSMVILANVILRRLENHGREQLARRLDVYAIIGYPMAYLAGATALYIGFMH